MPTAPLWLVIALPPPLSGPDAAPDWLGDCALSFTPRVTGLEDAWGLEVASVLRLWGGWPRLLQKLAEAVQCAVPRSAGAGVPLPEWSLGPTALAALACWRAQRRWPLGEVPRESVAEPRLAALHDLPLHTLTAVRPHAAAMATLGVHTWGQLRRLPRDGVTRRWGPGVLAALDQAWGLQPETHRWREPALVFDQGRDLPWPTDNVLALLSHAHTLLEALGAWLRQHQRGALSWEWIWTHDTRRHAAPSGRCELHTAQPTQAVEHMHRLTCEHWLRHAFASPVVALRLRVQHHAPWQPEATDAWQTPASLQRQPLSWTHLLERLAARLGPQAVVHWQARNDHRPECMQTAVEAKNAAAYAYTAWPKEQKHTEKSNGFAPPAEGTTGPWPTWLLAQPLPLTLVAERPSYLGPLQLLLGPHRLEVTQWPNAADPSAEPGPDAPAAAVLRDYFVARSPKAGWVWVFRETPGQRWYLHGLFA